jgi:hypothetical protein
LEGRGNRAAALDYYRRFHDPEANISAGAINGKSDAKTSHASGK